MKYAKYALIAFKFLRKLIFKEYPGMTPAQQSLHDLLATLMDLFQTNFDTFKDGIQWTDALVIPKDFSLIMDLKSEIVTLVSAAGALTVDEITTEVKILTDQIGNLIQSLKK